MLIPAERLHIGSGPQILPGWTNVDSKPYPGVDHVLDVTRAFPFTNVRFIFAEHFIEHLEYSDALAFLRNCRAVLADDGVLRISTPNLDWVWITQYHYGNWSSTAQQIQDCFGINKGFHGWGHRFLYNMAVLTETLHDAGFAHVTPCEYGASAHDALRELERHEKYLDTPELPHIIIAEATGRRGEGTQMLEPSRGEYLSAVADA
ncbi:MAG TPA: hypothetical protein VJZ00_18975 [Thermoanaerobaculia bacterium]|nr:hypothetical protein [Thermoanaerobaculia bacterium]